MQAKDRERQNLKSKLDLAENRIGELSEANERLESAIEEDFKERESSLRDDFEKRLN